jgi:hypothetical protein
VHNGSSWATVLMEIVLSENTLQMLENYAYCEGGIKAAIQHEISSVFSFIEN